MPEPPPRHARLVLVRRSGALLGALPPFPVATPWWQEVLPVVRAARERHGAAVVVLRLLDADRAGPHGGRVTYLAELDGPVPDGLEAWAGRLDEHPLRAPWARPGGPAADLAWAEAALGRNGIRCAGPPEQVRSWNLSSLWRLPTSEGTAWLKHVPSFFAHEGAILDRLAGRPVPRLLARDGGRILMAEVPGEDLHEARRPVLERLVDRLVALQRDWAGRADELLALGLPDWREPVLAPAIDQVVEQARDLSLDDRRRLAAFVAGLHRRFAALRETGLPDTLVHGDFHPGNARGDEHRQILLDWGDSGVGHPLLDEPAYLERIPAADVEPLRRRWSRAWRRAIPGSDPDRAAALLRPVAAARRAVIYRHFLEGIEPSERRYHATDVGDWLRRTASLLAAPER